MMQKTAIGANDMQLELNIERYNGYDKEQVAAALKIEKLLDGFDVKDSSKLLGKIALELRQKSGIK